MHVYSCTRMCTGKMYSKGAKNATKATYASIFLEHQASSRDPIALPPQSPQKSGIPPGAPNRKSDACDEDASLWLCVRLSFLSNSSKICKAGKAELDREDPAIKDAWNHVRRVKAGKNIKRSTHEGLPS